MKSKTIRINGVLITPETFVKVVKFDQNPKDKNKIKLLEINERLALEVIDFYKDIFICLEDGTDMIIESNNVPKVLGLLKISKDLTKTLNVIETFENNLCHDLQIQ